MGSDSGFFVVRVGFPVSGGVVLGVVSYSPDAFFYGYRAGVVSFPGRNTRLYLQEVTYS